MNYLLTACISLFLASFVAAADDIPKFCSESMKCNSTIVNVTCVAASTNDGCVKDVVDRKADLTLASVKDLVKYADKLKIVYGQKLKDLDKFVRYYSLAVVQKDAKLKFTELKGKKSCHTGVGKTAGWEIPVGYLLFKKEMVYTKDQYQSAADFFSESCAPGIKDIAGVSAEVKNDLCKLCNGTCAQNSATEPYYSHVGAFKCMTAGNNDRVGFMKHGTAEKVIATDPGKYGTISDYKLLCRDGSTKTLTEFKSCNIGMKPAYALVTSKNTSDAMVKKMQDMLKNADLAELEKYGMVSSNIDKLEKYSGTVEEYVKPYGDYYNALSGKGIPPTVPSAAPSNLVLFALQVIAIFAFVFLV